MHRRGHIGGDGAVAAEPSFQDQGLDAGAGDGADALGQEFVEPDAAVFGGGGQNYEERGCGISHRVICEG